MDRPPRILTIAFSQSGQLSRIVESIATPIRDAGIEVVDGTLQPPNAYPFPWPFLRFFDQFPETVNEDVPEVTLVDAHGAPIASSDFDLVILGYQVWFLAPSPPVIGFLKSDQARQILADRRVVTVIGCRNMWLMAQERMTGHLRRLGAKLTDNVALTDRGHAALTFVSTPLWMLTGKPGPWLAGLIPRAGVSEQDISGATRFGAAIARALVERQTDDTRPMLRGLGAVRINPNLIQSEKAGRRSFRAWGALLRRLGPQGAVPRRVVLVFFIVFLVTLILTLVPAVALLRYLLRPFMRTRQAAEIARYAAPSGE